jgi:hypothetical protein
MASKVEVARNGAIDRFSISGLELMAADILMPKSYKVCMMDIPINIFQRHIIN